MQEQRRATISAADLGRLHELRIDWLEEAKGDALALSGSYPDGHSVRPHRHSRSQLLHARAGVVLVGTEAGRWMVPPGHGIWIPAGVEHAVEMLGAVRMQSVYVAKGAIEGLPETLRVVGLSDLMRSLLDEAVTLPPVPCPSGRHGLVMGLLLHEIPRLREMPLGLPLPADARLAALCRRFVENPSPKATIDGWAAETGMSRRSFTRAFQRETGLSLSVWRQQACLFAALPRLADGEPVTGVALDLGYESVAAFTTMFRRMLGASPRAWLRAGGGGAARREA